MKSKLIFSILMILTSFFSYANEKSEYEEAKLLIKQNKIEEGLAILEKIAVSDDREYVVKSNYQLGIYYSKKGEVEKSKIYFANASKDKENYYSESVDALYNLALIYLVNNDLVNSEKYANELKERINEKDSEDLYLLYKYYLKSGKLEESEKYLKKIIELNPDALNYQTDLLEIYELKNDKVSIDETISKLKSMNNNITNRDIGIYFLGKENILFAIKYLMIATNQDKDVLAEISLGMVYYAIDRKEEAMALLFDAKRKGEPMADEAIKKIKLDDK